MQCSGANQNCKCHILTIGQNMDMVRKGESVGDAISDRKCLNGSTFQELDDAMSKWFLQNITQWVSISGPIYT